MMPNEGSEYKSIEEVRSILYPRSAAMLDLEKEDVLEFPASLTDESLQATEEVGKRSGNLEGDGILKVMGHKKM
jgi:hypothetical protein